LAVDNNTQEKMHISLEAEWNRQGYTFPWRFSATAKKMIIPWRLDFGTQENTEPPRNFYFGVVYAPVARLEAIRILLAYTCAHNIELYQMDVKSAFLNGYINGLVYVEQPPGFEDDKKPNHVYKLKKALYGLKQAPRAWYERLRDFLLSKGFKMGKVDTTLFTKKIGNDLFVLQLYVDDIIFGSTNQDFCEEFGNMMANEFEMSMIGELSHFLGLQIKQMKNGTFVSQGKY
jgi:hypothetical protein